MKYLSEYRSPQLVSRLLQEIRSILRGNWNIMEVCGGQTHSLVKNGLIDLLPPGIRMIHGPGCPVCVTPIALICFRKPSALLRSWMKLHARVAFTVLTMPPPRSMMDM